MRALIFLSLILASFYSCGSFSTLDANFDRRVYKKLHFKNLAKEAEISPSDLVILNYAISRQRDYFNYQIEGITYREILEMAKGFQENGWPVAYEFEQNGTKEGLLVKTRNEGSVLKRKDKNKARSERMLMFSAAFENTTDQDIALQSTTFGLYGPLQDHVTTVGYKLNCLVPAGQTQAFLFLVRAKHLQRNIQHNGDPELSYLAFDSLIDMFKVESFGHTYTTTFGIEVCESDDDAVLATDEFEYIAKLKGRDWIKRDGEGKVVSLNMGKAHFE